MGKAKATVKINASATDREALLKDTVANITSFMPKDAVLTEVRPRGLYGANYEYAVSFEHPIFRDGTQIELRHARTVYFAEEKPVTVQLLKSIGYYLRGREIFN